MYEYRISRSGDTAVIPDTAVSATIAGLMQERDELQDRLHYYHNAAQAEIAEAIENSDFSGIVRDAIQALNRTMREVSRLESDNKKLQEDNQKLEEDRNKIQQSHQKLLKDNQKLEGDLKDRQRRLEAAKQQADEAKKECEKLKKELGESERRLEEAEQQADEAKKECEKLKKELIGESERRLEEAEQQADEAKKECENMNKKELGESEGNPKKRKQADLTEFEKGVEGHDASLITDDEQIQSPDEIDCKVGHPGGSTNDEKWMIKYQELAEFYKNHGHLRVEYNGSLYNWMVVQRRRRKGVGGRTPLTDKEIELLDKIDFPWDPCESGWNSRYQELVEFYKKHGHLRVEIGSTLYKWMARQRRRRKGLNGSTPLTDKHIQLLEEIDFPWSHESEWMKTYQELAEFHKTHGHLRVEHSGSLYHWMRTQRKKYKGTHGCAPLTDKQIQKLEEIDFSLES